MAKYRIVMVRHGESEWNQLNLFCGWFDAGLSEKGKQCYVIIYSRTNSRILLINIRIKFSLNL